MKKNVIHKLCHLQTVLLFLFFNFFYWFNLKDFSHLPIIIERQISILMRGKTLTPHPSQPSMKIIVIIILYEFVFPLFFSSKTMMTDLLVNNLRDGTLYIYIYIFERFFFSTNNDLIIDKRRSLNVFFSFFFWKKIDSEN